MASTGCRPEGIGFCSIHLESVGAHPNDWCRERCCSEVAALQTDDRAHRLGCHLHTDEGRQQAVASRQCSGRTGSVQRPTLVVHHTESALETKQMNQFGRIGGGKPDKTGTTDEPNQLCHKSAPGAAEECGGLPCRRLQINLIVPAQTDNQHQYLREYLTALWARQSLTSGWSCMQCGVGRFADSTHFPAPSFLPFHLSLPFPATNYTAGYLGIIPHP